MESGERRDVWFDRLAGAMAREGAKRAPSCGRDLAE